MFFPHRCTICLICFLTGSDEQGHLFSSPLVPLKGPQAPFLVSEQHYDEDFPYVIDQGLEYSMPNLFENHFSTSDRSPPAHH